jgi:hypothetical protein
MNENELCSRKIQRELRALLLHGGGKPFVTEQGFGAGASLQVKGGLVKTSVYRVRSPAFRRRGVRKQDDFEKFQRARLCDSSTG